MTVVSSDDDQSVLELSEVLKLLECSSDSVIELQQFSKSAVIVCRGSRRQLSNHQTRLPEALTEYVHHLGMAMPVC